jgi:hypothetical protein
MKCPECDGEGMTIDYDAGGNKIGEKCDVCKGTGEVSDHSCRYNAGPFCNAKSDGSLCNGDCPPDYNTPAYYKWRFKYYGYLRSEDIERLLEMV